MAPIEFFVAGLPKGQPRVKAFRRGNHAGVYDPGTAASWKSAIRADAMPYRPGFTGPIWVKLQFVLPRPKAHFLKSGLRHNAPRYHTGKPDADNLAKAVLDALGDLGTWWKDDAQVARLTVAKAYGSEPGCLIRVEELEDAI